MQAETEDKNKISHLVVSDENCIGKNPNGKLTLGGIVRLPRVLNLKFEHRTTAGNVQIHTQLYLYTRRWREQERKLTMAAAVRMLRIQGEIDS